MQGLNWITRTIPLGSGLNQKADTRALEPPGLLRAVDVQFDETGGIQTRLPYPDLGADIFGGGTLSNVRRIVENGDELLCFTQEALYSWNSGLSKWVSKGTHLAVKVDERTQFATTGDQFCCDRAELSNTIVFAWLDGQVVYAAALDKLTMSVLMAPSVVSTGEARPRLVALSTKILLFVVTGDPQLNVYAIDPASPATAIAGAATTVLASPDMGTGQYDAVKIPGADTAIWAAKRATTTSYTIGTVTSALVVSSSTKARTCDGAIAVSVKPDDGLKVQVIRGNGTNVQGDYITIASFVDVTTGQAVGTIASGTVTQIAAAHRSVADGGAFRCYAFWDSAEASAATDWTSKFNYVDTAGTIGTQANFIRRLAVASRAFDHNGRVFVNMVFAGESSFSGASASTVRAQLQNTYFLYRDDAFLVGKIAAGRAGGFSPVAGWLPGVARTSGTTVYSWCATERRIIALGGTDHTGYDARAPRDVTVTFDSNEARRVARLGQTLYLTGGEILQYDGVRLTECGYHIYPWYFGAIEVGTGNLADGTYTLKVTWRWDNARGEIDRSTTATSGQVTISGGPNGISIVSWIPLFVTHKTDNAIAVEVWRTPVNPPLDSPFYLVTAKDPTDTSNPNRYIPNAPTSSVLATLNDELADADLIKLETNPENGGVLENLAPPAASIITASDTRLFLAGIAGDPDRVWYSKQRIDGQVAAFHDTLAIDIPRAGGAITALAFLNETLIVFRETAIYACAGDGFDNTGGGQNYIAREISGDVGAVSHEAVGKTPLGLVFKSSKGWQLLNRGWAVNYIGGGVADYDSETVQAVQVVETQHQVRCLTSSRMLVLDYIARGPDGTDGQWGEWTISSGVGATMWQGVHVYATSSAVKAQQSLYTGLTYGWDVETAWIKLNELTGYGQVAELQFLLEWRSACAIRVRVARDYQQTYFDDKIMQQEPGRTVGDPWQFRHAPSIQPMEAIKIRLTAIGPATTATLNTGVDYDADPIEMKTAVGVFAGVWTSLLQAQLAGEDGNDITMTVGCKLGTTRRIRTRDHQTWNPVTETWSNLLNNVGVQIVAAAVGDPQAASAAQIEASITANSELIEVNTPDSTPTDQVDMATMTGLTMTADFGITTAGADADNTTAPTGEAAKLTGITLKLGIRPGLHRNIPPARLQ